MKLKEKFKIEYLIYLFLVLTPFFDAGSFLVRENFTDIFINPFILLRLIIPAILCIYIFIKDRKSRKVFIGLSVIYIIYGFLHLVCTNDIITGISYGNLSNELQYVINYTYMIFLFYALYWFNKNCELKHIKLSLTIMIGFYLLLILISFITNTYSPTYIEGIGIKGWNASGNGLSAIFILTTAIISPYLISNIKKWWTWVIIIFLAYFLIFVFGTRTGIFGVILVAIVYLFSSIVIKIQNKIKINWKYIIIFSIIIITSLCLLLVIIGSNMSKRREHLNNITNDIIDPITNKPAHLTGDITNIIVDIKSNNIKKDMMSEEQKQSFLKLYAFANKYNVQNNDQRTQQFMYHYYFFGEQKKAQLYLFGNGYQSHYRELTLEMEVPALIFNFGIVGFILYLGPFLAIDFYMTYYLFRNFKKVTIAYMMSLFGCLLSLALSFLTGYVYFYISSMLIVICAHIILLKEKENLK